MPRSKSVKPTEDQYLRAVDIARRMEVNRSTITHWVEKGYLPKPIQFTPTFRAWRRSDIEDWIAKKELTAKS